MKLRFLAAFGGEEALAGLEMRLPQDGLRRLSSAPRLSIWTVPGTPQIALPHESGALIGLLFDRATGARIRSLPEPSQVRRRILTEYWGAYVLLASTDVEALVLRDPSGSIPVYYGSHGGAELFASDPDLLARAWPEPFQPDIDYIRHWLCYPFLRTARTGARGVSELLPGSCWERSGSSAHIVQAWTPADHVQPGGKLPPFEETAQALQEAVCKTVSSLAVDGEQLSLQLSGGLDSSILAAALTKAGKTFSAVTFATRDPDGDERRYARQAAAASGAKLIEIIEEEAVPHFEETPWCPFRPPPNPLLQPLQRALALQHISSGAGLVLDGAGGDNLFGFLSTASPAVDALRQNGPLAALRALQDIASLHGSDVWTAARLAARRALRPPMVPWPKDLRFLDNSSVLDAPEPHPWLQPAPMRLPGKADHIRMIVGIHHFLQDPSPAGAATLHPLLSQPLLEMCLSIPAWYWSRNSRDRAVARTGFQGLVPDPILARRSKGRLESMFVKGYLAAKSELEQFLLDGALRALGIVDAETIRAYVRDPGQPRDAGYIRLLELAAAEQWLGGFSHHA